MMATPPPRRVCILATDQVFASTLMQAKDFFHLANLRHGMHREPLAGEAFSAAIASPDGNPVCSFSGVPVAVDQPLGDAELILLPAFWEDFDTLLARYPQVLPWLRQQHARGAVLCGEATGVFWLAEAGLLDGLAATTYWRYFDTFAQRYPKVLLSQEKHLTDAGNLFCTAGMTSSSDLYIYLIERFYGLRVAQGVARDIQFELNRNYQPGRIGFGGQKLHQDPAILKVQQWLEEHFTEKFRFEDIAREHGMSIRNFMRRFQAATGDKPLHYLQRLRIETARGLLTTTRRSIKAISYEVGYDDASFFARLFRQHTGVQPNAFRQQRLPATA